MQIIHTTPGRVQHGKVILIVVSLARTDRFTTVLVQFFICLILRVEVRLLLGGTQSVRSATLCLSSGETSTEIIVLQSVLPEYCIQQEKNTHHNQRLKVFQPAVICCITLYMIFGKHKALMSSFILLKDFLFIILLRSNWAGMRKGDFWPKGHGQGTGLFKAVSAGFQPSQLFIARSYGLLTSTDYCIWNEYQTTVLHNFAWLRQI